jgi:long-chain acyl-CoA synthetase
MSIFSDISRRYSDRVAAINEAGDALTYQELGEFSARIGKLVDKRTVVCCLCENTIAAMSGYAAFIENKIVPIMIDGAIDKAFLRNICTIYDPEYIWLSSDRTDLTANRDIAFSFGNYSLIKMGGSARFPLHDDLAVLLSTSGSTGSPKFVRLSYRNLEANAESIVKYLSISELDRPITTLPMSYSFGLSIINSHLIQGATILLTAKSVMERDFWDFVKNQCATSLSGVPYTFEMLKKLRFFKMDLPHLETLTQAGGKMHNELSEQFSHFCRDNGKKMFFMYGQTEATARMSYLSPNDSISRLGSIGIAIPGGEFLLVDDQGNVINQSNETGELVYKGKNVSMGYASAAQDLIKGDENNGILMTGDLALRDDDGFYYIIGRKSRFIKIYGNRVNLDEAEQLIKNITSDVACVGSDEKMIIYISNESLVSEVRSFIATKTGINFRAFEVRVIANIPKSSSGKLIYRDLQT